MTDILWVFIIVAMIMPMIAQSMQEVRRNSLMTKMEKERSSRVIALIHRQETMSILGF
ncbi:MAG: hypothetical protein K2X29_13220, partial [Candidatus Obscuribacterales bacterium]|nr:hypothetical protein [Candidatus Obscuribacterales bacterium]